MRRQAGPLVAWAFVLAVLSFGGVTHQRERFLRSPEGRKTLSLSPARLLEEVRLDWVNDGDALRYRAYVDAALGRPYQSYYVRTLAQWLSSFAGGDAALEPADDPDHSPVATPPHPLVPWRDYLVEYPPGFFLWALPPALLARSPAAYVAIFCGQMALLLTGALLLCLRLAGRMGSASSRAAVTDVLPAFAAASVAALGVVCTHRYDAAISLLLCAAAWAAAEDRPAVSGIALGLAIASKLTPIFAAPVLLAYFIFSRRQRSARRFFIATAATALLVCAPALIFAGTGLLEMLRYHALRPLQTESTAAALLGLARAFNPAIATTHYAFGSLNLEGPAVGALSRIFTALSGLAVLAVLWLAALRLRRATALDPVAPLPAAQEAAGGAPREEPTAVLVEGMVAVLLAFMGLGKVFSPQYLVWLLPLGLVAALFRSRRAALAMLALFALTQVLYPYSYGALRRLETWSYALLLARNALLIGLGVFFALPPARGQRAHDGAGKKKAPEHFPVQGPCRE